MGSTRQLRRPIEEQVDGLGGGSFHWLVDEPSERKSKTARMWGWLSDEAARASCSKRRSRSGCEYQVVSTDLTSATFVS